MTGGGGSAALRTGLIGAHIGGSRFAAALRIMCADAGIDLAFEAIDTADLAAFDFDAKVADLRAAGWTGVSVTHPHKIDAARFAGAGMTGGLHAANTLVFGDTVRGYNTDYSGFLGAWKHIMGAETPGRVAMAGAGGVARAIAPALRELGAEAITVWDVAPDRARALADHLGAPVMTVAPDAAADAVRRADGLVNATAMGMVHAPGSAIDAAWIGGQRWAFDAVYTPTDTAFLTAADRAGLRTISGFDFFCHMALGAFAAYTGIRPDPDRTLAKLAALKPD
jgi:shikimate dehydrogenase